MNNEHLHMTKEELSPEQREFAQRYFNRFGTIAQEVLDQIGSVEHPERKFKLPAPNWKKLRA